MATLYGRSPWQAGPTITGLSAGITSGAAPVTSNIFANPVLTGSSALPPDAAIILTLGTPETATSAGGWIGITLLKASTATGPIETARVANSQLFPYNGGRYGQIPIAASGVYTATEWITLGDLLVPASPYLAIAVFNNSSFTIPTTAVWTIQFSGADAG
ncbi:MAG: hypothetical protein HIU82_02060 [Proteobacteria bacterium]|nr:hypothetical protein [Pseudomonadota bacterium]